MPSTITTLGQATPVTVQIHDPRGVRKMTAAIEQNGASYAVAETSQASKPGDSNWTFTTGVKGTPQLKDGAAKLIVEATSNDLVGNKARVQRDITVVTRPPSLSVDSDQHYLYLGMADLVTFDISGGWTAAGVRVGDQTYRSWPMLSGKSGSKPGRFSLFAFAWNMPPGTAPGKYRSENA